MSDKIRTVDFDAFRAEQEGKPVTFKIGGKKYNLPPELPAEVAVGIIRLRAEVGDEGEIPQDSVDFFGKAMFGEVLWGKILTEHRLTVPEMPVLLQKVLEVYTGEAPKVANRTSVKKASNSA